MTDPDRLHNEAIVRNIARALKKSKRSRYWLASRSGIATNVLSRLESGKSKDPRISTVALLAEALGLTVSELIDDPLLASRKTARLASLPRR